MKKYCECFSMGASCSENCKCAGCRNHDGAEGTYIGQGSEGLPLKRTPEKGARMSSSKVKVVDAAQARANGHCSSFQGVLGITKKPAEVKETSLDLTNKKRINIFPGKISRNRVEIRISGFTSEFLKQIERQAWDIVRRKETASEANLLSRLEENPKERDEVLEQN